MSQTPAVLHWFIPLGLGRPQWQWGRALGVISLMGLTACGLQSDARLEQGASRADMAGSQGQTVQAQPAQDVARTRLSEPSAPTDLLTPRSSDSTHWAAATLDPSRQQGISPASLLPDQGGRFRVGNQTEHPIRIAFLPQSQALPPNPAFLAEATELDDPAGLAGEDASSRPALDLEPIHWDFAPGEGSSKGLLLSLPGGDLDLQQGDVLVAFAQDGSSRYWGPYVVGQTQLPYWNGDRQEWQLLIQP